MSGRKSFEVWSRDGEAPTVVDVDNVWSPPEWHVIGNAAIRYAKVLVPRPSVVMVRPVGQEAVHYCSMFGPDGEGTYAKYLGHVLPPKRMEDPL